MKSLKFYYFLLVVAICCMISSCITIVKKSSRPYFEAQFKEVRQEFEDYRKHIDRDILSSVSNICKIALDNIANPSFPSVPSNLNSFSASSNIQSSVIGVTDLLNDSVFLDFSYQCAFSTAVSNDSPSILYDGYFYRVGDCLFDSEIKSISPSCVMLSNGVRILPLYTSLYKQPKEKLREGSYVGSIAN